MNVLKELMNFQPFMPIIIPSPLPHVGFSDSTQLSLEEELNYGISSRFN